ncbi:MAG: hypothetical protein R2747_09155 [Pyrinomonadaceae bacterium]
MKELVLPAGERPRAAEKNINQTKKKTFGRRKSWKLALYLSISSGFLLGLTGLIVSALAHTSAVERNTLVNEIGTFLVLSAAPLYFLAAHCLDKVAPRRQKLPKGEKLPDGSL